MQLHLPVFFHATAATRARSISWVQTPLKRPACRKCARDTSPSKFDNAPAAARTRVALLPFSRPASRLPLTPPAVTVTCAVPAGLPVVVAPALPFILPAALPFLPPAATVTCVVSAGLPVVVAPALPFIMPAALPSLPPAATAAVALSAALPAALARGSLLVLPAATAVS